MSTTPKVIVLGTTKLRPEREVAEFHDALVGFLRGDVKRPNTGEPVKFSPPVEDIMITTVETLQWVLGVDSEGTQRVQERVAIMNRLAQACGYDLVEVSDAGVDEATEG